MCDAFAPFLPRGGRVALVDFPDFMNCGDHAIWLGEKQLLLELGANLVYQCSTQSYVREEMAEKLGDGAILFHGTANATGRGAANREFRLRVRNDFPNNEAIVFPRQDGFASDDYLRRNVDLVSNSSKLTLFAASRAGRQTLEHHFGTWARVELAPDPVFMLGHKPRSTEPIYDIVWIARTDGDKANAGTEVAARLSSQAAEKFSIPGFSDGIEISFVAKHRPPTILLTDWQALVFDNQQARWALKRLDFDAWAEVLVSRALYILSLGHVVITDRLHGHLLCLLLRIPHILLNDDCGKNWTFQETWTKDAELCRLARDPPEALSLARNAAVKLKDLSPAEAERWSWQGIAGDVTNLSGGH